MAGSARIGSLHVMLGLNSADFDKGLKKAQSGMTGFTRGVNAGLSGLVRGFAAPLAGALTLTAAINGTRRALQNFGDIADNAAATGLDAEFFQGLAYQAELGGVSIDALSSALASFAKNAGLAAEGKGRMVSTLKALDPVLLENIRKAVTQEQRIKLVADALAKETDAARRAAIATAAFGDVGAKLAGVFAGGAAQIEALQVKARELGLIVDRELIARADELGDEFDTTQKIVDLQLQQAFVNLGPILIWLTGLAGGLAEQVGRTVDGLNSIDKQSSATLEGRLKGIETQLLGNDPMTSPNIAQVGGIDPAAAEAEKAAIMAELRKRALDNLRTQLLNKPPVPVDIPTLEETGSQNDAAAAAIKHAEAVKELIADLQFEGQMIGRTAAEQEVLSAIRWAGAGATREQQLQIESLILANSAELEAIEANTEAMQALGDIGQTALRGIVDALADGKVEAQEFGDILGNVLGMASDFFLNAAFKGMGTAFGIPGFASGTSFAPGGLAMVGEQGPELVNLPRGSEVFSAPETAAMMGGSGSAVTLNVNVSGDPREWGAQIANALTDFSKNVLPNRVAQITANPYRR